MRYLLILIFTLSVTNASFAKVPATAFAQDQPSKPAFKYKQGLLQGIFLKERTLLINQLEFLLDIHVPVHLQGTEHGSLVNLRVGMPLRFIYKKQDRKLIISEIWELPKGTQVQH